MNIYVDIDNTITITEGTDYENAKPVMERIQKINVAMNGSSKKFKTGIRWKKNEILDIFKPYLI